MKDELDILIDDISILFKKTKNINVNKSLSYDIKDLFENVKNYSDVCNYLNIKELTLNDFEFLPEEQRLKTLSFHKIQNICKLFNGNWVLNWNNKSQNKYFPYFIKEVSGWQFYYSVGYCDRSSAEVGFYSNQKISDHCGKLFIQEYSDFMN